MVAKLDGTNGLLQQYDYQAPSTGFSYTFAAGVNVLVMNPAGTLATGTITMPASPADGMTISFSSTQTITALTVNANTGQSIVRKPTSFGAGSAMTFVYRLSNTTWYPMTNYATAGTVLQVVSTTKTDTFSTTVEDTVFVDITGLSASITPTSATNTILVLASIGKCSCTTSSRAVNFRLDRNGTSIALGDTAGNRVRISFSSSVATSEQGLSASLNFIDSPASTSALTYKIQMSGHNGEATVINRNGNNLDNNDAPAARSISTLILMEIAA